MIICWYKYFRWQSLHWTMGKNWGVEQNWKWRLQSHQLSVDRYGGAFYPEHVILFFPKKFRWNYRKDELVHLSQYELFKTFRNYSSNYRLGLISRHRINVSDYSLEATNMEMAKANIEKFVDRIKKLLQEFNGANIPNAASQQDFRYHLEYWLRLLIVSVFT